MCKRAPRRDCIVLAADYEIWIGGRGDSAKGKCRCLIAGCRRRLDELRRLSSQNDSGDTWNLFPHEVFAPDPAVMAWLRGRLDSSFAIVDKHLENRRYMVGDAPTIADLSLCGYLFFPVEESGYEIAARYPHVSAWLSRVQAIPGWANPYDILPGDRIAAKW